MTEGDGTQKFRLRYSPAVNREVAALEDKYRQAQEGTQEHGGLIRDGAAGLRLAGETRDPVLRELRRLDGKIELPAVIRAVLVGAAGTLVLGGGLSAVLLTSGALFYIGILVGAAGLLLMSFSLPYYRKEVMRARKRHAGEMLAKIAELTKGTQYEQNSGRRR